MEHFVRVVFEKQNVTEALDESIFPGNEILETEHGASVFQIPLSRALNEDESDEYADRLAAYMFEQGYDDFDIEITADDVEETDEITISDDDDIHEWFGDMYYNDDDVVDEAEYQGRNVKLGKPMQGDVKKFKVYVKNPKGNVVKVNFGSKEHKIKKSNPGARKSFRARHNCDNPGPRHKARYWSCRKW